MTTTMTATTAMTTSQTSFFLFDVYSMNDNKIKVPLGCNHGIFKWNLQCNTEMTRKTAAFLGEVFHCSLAQYALCIASLYNATPVTISLAS